MTPGTSLGGRASNFRGRGRGRGYTLLELLAVIVIMALAAGFILPGVAAADEASRCRSMAAALRELDQKARLLARSEGSLTCTVDDETHSFVLSGSFSHERIAIVSPGPGMSAVLRVEQELHTVHYDRTGKSPNFEIDVTFGSHSCAFRVTGATGDVREVKR